MKIIKIGTLACPSCLLTNEIMSEIKERYPNIEIVNLDYIFDVEKVRELYDGFIIPTVIFKRDDNSEITRIIGDQNIEDIEKIIRENR